MKKLLALLLAMIVVLSLVACGDEGTADNDDDDDDDDEKTTQTEKAEGTGEGNDTAPVTPDVTLPGQGGVETAPSQGGEVSTTPADQQGTATPGEVVVVDNDKCTIKILGDKQDDFWGYMVNVQVTNKTSDKTFMFAVDDASINGVQCGGSMYVEVAPGKMANESVSFFEDALKENGLTEYTDIELMFSVMDAKDIFADAIYEGTAHYYPKGQDKASQFVRAPQPTDNVIMDNEFATVVVTGYTDDPIFGFAVNFYIVNKSNKDISINVDNVSVNDCMAEPFLFGSVIYPNRATFTDMSWLDEDFEKNNITTVQKIEFDLTVEDWENWDSTALASTKVTLNP